MTKRRTFLILTILFTLLFIALVTLGAYLLSIQSKQFAVAAFLFAFGAVFAQIG
ncbi:NGO_0222 family membrane protein, partial [Neisseria sp. GT4A_CT1]